MDLYKAALKRLKADTTPLLQLSGKTGVAYTTLREIASGDADNPGYKTVQKIAAYYFPKELA